MLKGQWLKEAGFNIGDSITVICEDGKLIITPREEASIIKFVSLLKLFVYKPK